LLIHLKEKKAMPATAATQPRDEDRLKAAVISVLLHLLLLLLLIFLQVGIKTPPQTPPPIVIEWGGGGSKASPGLPDRGQGSSPAPQGQQMEDPSSKTPAERPAPSSTPQKTSPPPKPTTPSANNTPTSTDPDVAALRRAQEEARRKQQEDERRRKQEEADRQAAEQRRIAEEQERQRREKEEADRKRGQFGSAFGRPGSGTGQGNTGRPGNQGQPGGTGNNPFGQGGSGGGSGGGDGQGVGESIGGGLSGRRVISRPKMVDDTQYTGRVAIRVCVNSEGEVVSATYTQVGSTTTEGVLRNKALSWARQYRFGPDPDVSEQCGTITFDFRVK
jgi:outer membrane biosynthesis protein TonB